MKSSARSRIKCYMDNLPWFWEQTKKYNQKQAEKNVKLETRSTRPN